MSRPSRLLSQHEVRIQTDQELARSYCELQKMRRQVRIAECGRAIRASASDDLLAKTQMIITILE
jgi:hypothetical protein